MKKKEILIKRLTPSSHLGWHVLRSTSECCKFSILSGSPTFNLNTERKGWWCLNVKTPGFIRRLNKGFKQCSTVNPTTLLGDQTLEKIRQTQSSKGDTTDILSEFRHRCISTSVFFWGWMLGMVEAIAGIVGIETGFRSHLVFVWVLAKLE